MNRRGKRLTLGVMAMGLAVILALVIAHWGTVRDHVEAWRFQMTRETETIHPDTAAHIRPVLVTGYVLDALRVHSGCPVIYAPAEMTGISRREVMFAASWRPSDDRKARDLSLRQPSDKSKVVDATVRVLQAIGCRVLEQRFPRRAYVVIRDEGATR